MNQLQRLLKILHINSLLILCTAHDSVDKRLFPYTGLTYLCNRGEVCSLQGTKWNVIYIIHKNSAVSLRLSPRRLLLKSRSLWEQSRTGTNSHLVLRVPLSL